jgi:hypothetical protein
MRKGRFQKRPGVTLSPKFLVRNQIADIAHVTKAIVDKIYEFYIRPIFHGNTS